VQISDRVGTYRKKKASEHRTDLNVYENSVKRTELIYLLSSPVGRSAKCADNSFGSDIQNKRHDVLSRDEPTR